MADIEKRSYRRLVLPVVILATAAVAVLAGVAIARSFVLQVASNAQVTNTAGMTTKETIVVNTHGRAIYELTGDSRRHPECTKANSCFGAWPPVTVRSARHLLKAAGIKGRLGTWKRNGFTQLTLSGHPLYTFAGDTMRHDATGQGLQSFGGTWHVIKADPPRQGGGGASSSSSSSMSSSSSSSSSNCLYCY